MTREEAHLRNEAKFANLARAEEKIEAQQRIEERKDRAMRGWLTDSPPPPPRPDIPGEDHKWHLMMGAAQQCPRCREVVARLRHDKKLPPPD
jgi:hypothetical protein